MKKIFFTKKFQKQKICADRLRDRPTGQAQFCLTARKSIPDLGNVWHVALNTKLNSTCHTQPRSGQVIGWRSNRSSDCSTGQAIAWPVCTIFLFLNFLGEKKFLISFKVLYWILREFYSLLVEIQIQNSVKGSFNVKQTTCLTSNTVKSWWLGSKFFNFLVTAFLS